MRFLIEIEAVFLEMHHVGRAAARLGIEQSPLSRRLQALEQSVGAKLFDRTQRGVKRSGPQAHERETILIFGSRRPE
jgi:hypothetical protein